MILQELATIGKQAGEVSFDSSCADRDINLIIQGVASYEIPRGVILDTVNFTEENRRMTPTNKVCRRVVLEVMSHSRCLR